LNANDTLEGHKRGSRSKVTHYKAIEGKSKSQMLYTLAFREHGRFSTDDLDDYVTCLHHCLIWLPIRKQLRIAPARTALFSACFPFLFYTLFARTYVKSIPHFNLATDAEMTDALIVKASIPIIQLLRKSAGYNCW